MRLIVFILLYAVTVLPLFGERFAFKQQTGDKSRIVSSTKEEVYLNGTLAHRANIVNRMASEITGAAEGKAQLRAVFNVAEETESEDKTVHLQWGEEYISNFTRDDLGKITIDKHYFMPSARAMALFPNREVSMGESWIAQGEEAFDLRRVFNIKDPYTVPFRANINYAGMRVWRGKSYKTFIVTTSLLKNIEGFENAPRDYLNSGAGGTRRTNQSSAIPVLKRINGKSIQTLYWNETLGQPAGAEDEYELNFELSGGDVYQFKGKTVSELIEAGTMDKADLAREVREAVDALGIDDVSVHVAGEGITISLDDIQFAPDSAQLLASEKTKLDKLAQILLNYQNRDILVSGHTAQAGTESSSVRLSEERASAVAGYFIKSKIRAPEQVITRGFGSSRPAATNSTEEGRRKNRRVEITILEN